ncbi:DUF3883 domain-containing protein [Cellulomonas sp. FA1]|uniref:DUF3883 domain-containing protein n=1 Tax=Cellulomonas sp. FA1 TaxID=1346710 RepID=UPI0009E41EFD|nr:DUF3883 domain-containing protein [Cellulomonas sp. FA1]
MTPWTAHQVRAALRVARLLDPNPTGRSDLEAAFVAAATQGEHSLDDLRRAESLLAAAELVQEGTPVPALRAVVSLTDPEAEVGLRRLLASAARAASAHARAESGARGEEFVVEACVAELRALQRHDLAVHVQRVSLVSDSYGYDVAAPKVASEARLLEVKTAASTGGGIFPFFLSRHEYDTGRRLSTQWSLVGCTGGVGGELALLGWCRAATLAPYLPQDHNGRWTECAVKLPLSALLPGLPPPV